MGGVLTTISNWAATGLNYVAEGLKWLWQSVKNLFSSMADAFKKIFGSIHVSYESENERQAQEVQQNTNTGTERVIVETHRDRFSFRAGNEEVSRHRQSSDASKKRQMIETLDKAEKAFRDMKLIMIEDVEYQNSQLTNQKLQDFHQRHNINHLQHEIDSLGRVNPVL